MMTCWICGVSLEKPHTTVDLSRKCDIYHIKEVLRKNLLRLYGYSCEQDGATRTNRRTMNFQVNGPSPQGKHVI